MTQTTCTKESCSTEAATPDKSHSSQSQPAQSQSSQTYSPRFDVWESDDELVLFGDLPGVAPEDLDIRYECRELTILGKTTPRLAGKKLLHSEYGVGDFCRTFKIGETIDSDKISAELTHGVLKLHLPKAEAVKPRQIQVRGNDSR